MDDGTAVVQKWITDVPCNALQGIAKVCRNGELEDKDMPRWTRKVIGKLWNQVLDDVEVRHVFTRNIMWKSTDFHGHVVG